jgi:DNA-binding CsgD family transcriptional regulator
LNIAKNTNEKETVILHKKFQQANPSLLSDREKEILKLAIKGLTSKEIGNKLFISLNTVRNHKQNMMEKTNSPNIVSLIDYYLANERE